ncbi:MAG: NusG domain II-containing protein [Oscillospiraceae bacterium]|nr:NusG domain II-containing protein [Oscillospiraceae bacterium]
MKQHFSPELRPTRFDVLVAAAVAVLAIVLAFWFYGGLGRSGPVGVIITHQGEEVASYSLNMLDGDRTVEIEGEYHLTIRSTQSGVWVEHSDCPTQDCVRTGVISVSGQSIVCLPEKVVVKIVGMKTDDDPDLILG